MTEAQLHSLVDRVHAQRLDRLSQAPHNGFRDEATGKLSVVSAGDPPSTSACGHPIELVGWARPPARDLRVQVAFEEPD